MLLQSIIICSIICLVQSESCKHVLAELSDTQKNFVQCVTVNSVPVTMCISCKDKYHEVLKMYDALTTNCSDVYFDKDRINLIASTEFVLTGLWTKAYCDDCFNNNNSYVFYEKDNEFSKCLFKHKENPCENCKLQYLDLNTFYINLDQHNNGEVCYDLQDSMNRTRKKWSTGLNCCSREQNLTLFILVLSITSFLPLLFYGTTYCLTKRQERNERVLFNEGPYNSEVPSAPRQYNNFNNPTQPMPDNLPSSSNPVGSTSMAPKDINECSANQDMESSDDELLMTATVQLKEKIKNI